jgi:formate-dependent nitrite reductase membrane component NrfD
MIAAEVWHWWIGVVLTLVGVGTVLAMVAGYVAKVSATKYPGRRNR